MCIGALFSILVGFYGVESFLDCGAVIPTNVGSDCYLECLVRGKPMLVEQFSFVQHSNRRI